jgi:acetylornithine deacetylase
LSESVLELATALIDIESTSGSEKPMSDFLKVYLEERSWEVVLQEVEPERFNVWASRPGVDNPRVVMNTHIDTVPPFFPASRDETHLRGRGACDTKSLLAAQLIAAERLVAEGEDQIGLLYVVGEEVDHCGMIAANDLGLDPDYLIVGEPTESKLVLRQKGILKVNLFASGKAGHSGYPHTGISAIEPLLDVLQELRSESWPGSEALGDTTLNIGILEGGRAANVIPDQAKAELLFRVVTSHEAIEERLREITKERLDIEVVAKNNPTELTVFEGYETAVVSFNTDIPYLKFNGKSLLYGAGSILDAHTARENILIEDLNTLPETYYRLVKECFTRSTAHAG